MALESSNTTGKTIGHDNGAHRALEQEEHLTGSAIGPSDRLAEGITNELRAGGQQGEQFVGLVG